MKAHYLGRHHNMRWYRFPVRVVFCNSKTLKQQEVVVEVVANTAADAANAIAKEYRQVPETNIWAYGPQGGEVFRYVGWNTAIQFAMWDRPVDNQLNLL